MPTRHFGFVVGRQAMRLRLFGFSDPSWVEIIYFSSSFKSYLDFKCLKRVNELPEMKIEKRLDDGPR